MPRAKRQASSDEAPNALDVPSSSAAAGASDLAATLLELEGKVLALTAATTTGAEEALEKAQVAWRAKSAGEGGVRSAALGCC